MASLVNKVGCGKAFYYSYIRSVKWTTGRYQELDTSSKVTAQSISDHVCAILVFTKQ